MKKIYDIAMLIGWLLTSIGTALHSGIAIALMVAGVMLIALILLDVVLMMKGRA